MLGRRFAAIALGTPVGNVPAPAAADDHVGAAPAVEDLRIRRTDDEVWKRRADDDLEARARNFFVDAAAARGQAVVSLAGLEVDVGAAALPGGRKPGVFRRIRSAGGVEEAGCHAGRIAERVGPGGAGLEDGVDRRVATDEVAAFFAVQ